MLQMGINEKITFNKHFARKYIRAYTICYYRAHAQEYVHLTLYSQDIYGYNSYLCI